jgi:hypothetical protein
LGIGILAHVVGALGMAGMLKVGPLVGTALALLALGLWAGRSETKLGAVRPRTIWTVILGAALLALVAWPLLWRALWPPAEFDSVAYHLALARWWANHGRIDVVPHLRFPVAPHNAHALFAAFMVLQDEVAPQLLSVLAVILAGSCCYAAARTLGSPAAGILAAALWWSNPIVAERGIVATYHAFAALFAAAAFLSWIWWRQSDNWRPALLAGVFSGFCAGTYYLGLNVVALLGVAVLFDRREGMRRTGVAAVLAGTVVGGAPWYVRTAWYAGNPVWPFLRGIFGPGPWWSDADALGVATDLGSLGVSRSFANLFTTPWVLFRQPEVFQASGSGFSWAFGVALLLAVTWGLRTSQGRQLALGFGGLYVAWFFQAQALRYLLFALPLICVAGALAGEDLARRLVRRAPRLAVGVTVALAGVATTQGWLWAERGVGEVPTSEAAVARYIVASYPEYPGVAVANREPGLIYAFGSLYLNFYSKAGLLGDVVGTMRYQTVLDQMGSGEALFRCLRSFGAEYLLISHRWRSVPLPEDAEFHRHFELLHADGASEVFRLRASPATIETLPGIQAGDDVEGATPWRLEGRAEPDDRRDMARRSRPSLRLAPKARAVADVSVAPESTCVLRMWAVTRKRRRPFDVRFDWHGPDGMVEGFSIRYVVADNWNPFISHGLAPRGANGLAVSINATEEGPVWIDGATLRCIPPDHEGSVKPKVVR